MGVMDKLLRRAPEVKPLFGGEKDTTGYNPVGQAEALCQAAIKGITQETDRG